MTSMMKFVNVGLKTTDASEGKNSFMTTVDDREVEKAGESSTVLIRLQRLSMALGLCIGCFLQFCMLGFDYLVVRSACSFGTLCKGTCVALSSIAWSASTAIASLVILSLVRKIINPNLTERLLIHLECRFVVGVFAGVFMGCMITDMAVGSPGGLPYILLVGTIVRLCVAFALRVFSPDDNIDEDVLSLKEEDVLNYQV